MHRSRSTRIRISVRSLASDNGAPFCTLSFADRTLLALPALELRLVLRTRVHVADDSLGGDGQQEQVVRMALEQRPQAHIGVQRRDLLPIAGIDQQRVSAPAVERGNEPAGP